ncbi:MAG: hypothetical protein LBV17_00630 [Treponema sp.]|jgi:hypothetical protein|nr:hypothetical protein [Treponema sp.]
MKKTFKALLRMAVVIVLAAICGLGMMGCEQQTDGELPSSGITPTNPMTTDPVTILNKIIDFEDGWDSSGYGERAVAWSGYAWTVSGVVTTTDADKDRFEGAKSIRLRGNEGDNCRVELDSYINGIKSIYFDYASYGTHSNGTIVLYYQIKDSEWVKAGEVTAPAWEGAMFKASFDINKTNVRFKIVREGNLTGYSSVNIDNIVIAADSEDSFNVITVDPVPADFYISGLQVIADGNAKAVSITPKAGKSTGIITIWYEGIGGTSYAKSTTAPSAGGKYAVTFDVASSAGFNAVNGLAAGTLVIEEFNGQFILIDFEDAVWDGNGYTQRPVSWGGYEWAVSGVVSATDDNDRKEGGKSIRFRGGNANDSGNNTNRVELTNYLTSGIKSIYFDYGSYSSHSGGVIIVSYQKEGGSWVEAGRTDAIPSWTAGGNALLKASYNLNVTGKVRFKIEKLFVGSGSISANVDNIIITY